MKNRSGDHFFKVELSHHALTRSGKAPPHMNKVNAVKTPNAITITVIVYTIYDYYGYMFVPMSRWSLYLIFTLEIKMILRYLSELPKFQKLQEYNHHPDQR